MPGKRPLRPLVTPRAPAAGPIKPLVSEEEERKKQQELMEGYEPERKRIKKENLEAFAKADREGNSQEAQEYWAKVKQNCESDRNKTFADFVVVIVDMIQGALDMSKAIKATLKSSSSKFSAYHTPFKSVKDAIVRRRKNVDPNESAKGVERVIGKNLSITLNEKGELDIGLTIRGEKIKDPKMIEALDTMVMSYFQEEGFDFYVPPGSTKPRVVYSSDHPRCQPGAANPIPVDTPIERADFDKLVEDDGKKFKEYLQGVLDRPSPNAPVRGGP